MDLKIASGFDPFKEAPRAKLPFTAAYYSRNGPPAGAAFRFVF
jgi:hypothetical protein